MCTRCNFLSENDQGAMKGVDIPVRQLRDSLNGSDDRVQIIGMPDLVIPFFDKLVPFVAVRPEFTD